MSHEFETGFFVVQPAWHRLGNVVNKAPSIEEAIILAGLDWEVEMQPIFLANGKEVIDNKAIVRKTDQSVLGVASNRYTPLQNRSAFNFFDKFIQEKIVELETAGSLKGGRKVWILARIKGVSADVVTGDRIDAYLLLSTAHDGTGAVIVQFTPIRVVCANTMGEADRRAESGQDKSVSIRHNSKVEQNLKEVQNVIDVARRDFNLTIEAYRRLAQFNVGIGGLEKYVREVFEVPLDEKGRPGKLPRAFGFIEESFNQGPGAEMKGVEGTFWGAYNAITDWVDHDRGRTDDSRQDASWFGLGKTLRNRALKVALAQIDARVN